MKPQIASVIRRTSIAAATASAVLSPIPFADEVLLVPLFAFLATKVGRAHKIRWHRMPWKPLAITAVGGLGARAVLNLPTSAVPGVAAVFNATSAFVFTEFFGYYAADLCKHPEQARAYGVREIMAMLQKRLQTIVGA